MSAGSCAFSVSSNLTMVSPESIMSSTITTVRPFKSSFSPSRRLMCPVDCVPLYEEKRTKVISQSVVMPRNKSAANIKAPFKTAKKMGCLSFKSSLICAAISLTLALICASGSDTANSLSLTLIVSMTWCYVVGLSFLFVLRRTYVDWMYKSNKGLGKEEVTFLFILLFTPILRR